LKNYLYTLFAYTSLTIITAVSCTPEDFRFPVWQSEYIVPILDVEFGIKDLTLSDKSFNSDKEGLLILEYQSRDSLGTLEGLFPVTDQQSNFTIPGIPGNIPDFGTTLYLSPEKLGITPGFHETLLPISYEDILEFDLTEVFLKAQFEKGNIDLTFHNGFPFTIQSGFKLSLSHNDLEFPFFTYTTTSDMFPGDSLVIEPHALDNKTLNGNIQLTLENFQSKEAKNISINPDDRFTFKLKLGSIVFHNAFINVSDLEFETHELRIPFSLPGEARISKAVLDSGLLVINFPDYTENGPILRLTLPGFTQNGVPLSIPLGENYISMDLANLDFDFTDGDPPYNSLKAILELNPDDNPEYCEFLFSEDFNGSINIESIDYRSLEGYIGSHEEIIEGRIELDFFSRVSRGNIRFADPRISLGIYNSQGVTASFQDDGQGFYIKGQNPLLSEGVEVHIGQSLENFKLSAPTAMGESANSLLAINKETEPDFGNFLALMPTQIDFRLPVIIGTDVPEMNQFLYDKGELAIDLLLELPLEFSANNLVLTDTLPLNLDLKYDDLEIQKAVLYASISSHFPLFLDVQNYFLDEHYQVIDSLFTTWRQIQPAEISTNGIVAEPREALFAVEITRDKLLNIRNARYTIPVFQLSTPDQEVVKLISTYKAHIKLTGELDLNVDLNE